MKMARHAILLSLIVLLCGTIRQASGFALLGPFAPWMTAELSYQDGYSIGGPMDIGQGYRWNVPIITYDFDQSFLDFFGSNGVAAVEGAIKILNDLPNADSIILTNYPLNTAFYNWPATFVNLVDLKSTTLSLLLQQLGLAQPSRFVNCLSNFQVVDYQPEYTSLMRNFDPVTYQPSLIVNGVPFFGELTIDDTFWLYFDYDTPIVFVDEVNFQNPSDGSPSTAVADYLPSAAPNWQSPPFTVIGQYFTGLTRDDVGGLRYLLSTNNIAAERVIPGVQGVGPNPKDFIDFAPRPGIQKLSFQRFPAKQGSGRYRPFNYIYEDSFIEHGALRHQHLRRTVLEPDILFAAADLPITHVVESTGTSNWINNGAAGQDGPGGIRPPIKITFNTLGPNLRYLSATYPDPTQWELLYPIWGSYGGATNQPVTYPVITDGKPRSTKFHFWLLQYPRTLQSAFNFNAREFTWELNGKPNDIFYLQTSTNLTDWIAFETITNLGGTYTLMTYAFLNDPCRFFRTIPK